MLSPTKDCNPNQRQQRPMDQLDNGEKAMDQSTSLSILDPPGNKDVNKDPPDNKVINQDLNNIYGRPDPPENSVSIYCQGCGSNSQQRNRVTILRRSWLQSFVVDDPS
mmetsp:Transcript_19146/g.44495  ORF Transcript_19146/g.44495 Transcript_19146/m.44495 type:complete len:108 (+) Transcript_19146:177-500(+)